MVDTKILKKVNVTLKRFIDRWKIVISSNKEQEEECLFAKRCKRLLKGTRSLNCISLENISPAGNRTLVARVTGGNTHHYTTED